MFADARKFTEFAAMGGDDGLVAFMKLANTIKRGDIVGVKGFPGKTKVRPVPVPLLCRLQLTKHGQGRGGADGRHPTAVAAVAAAHA